MNISNDEADEKQIWSRYFAATSDNPVHPIFESLEPFLPDEGDAIDLGCGAGRGTMWLLEHGLHVDAVDISEEGLAYLKNKLPEDADARLICSSFQDLELSSYDVVVACFTLFFLPPDDFRRFWTDVVNAIKPGGLFAGQFLGVNDSWRERDFTTHDRGQVDELLRDFKVIQLNEEERDGETALKEQKHWHIFHVVARKK